MNDREYFERFLRIRPLIVDNKKIIGAMRHIVKEKLLDESPYFIGKGSSTSVYGLGRLEEFKEQELCIAMRIGYNSNIFNHFKEPFGHVESLAEGEVGAFEEAYHKYHRRLAANKMELLIPPFFAGMFHWKDEKGKTLFGVLTQDLSFNGQNRVIEDEWSERGIVVFPGGRSKEYFMDPRKRDSGLGEKYNKKGISIPLGRI
ncbi:hypothetical protein HOD29_03275 [archaeon]|jgi:hypothetical protein|nr:hypothetical protein [archaeon]